MVIYKMRSLLSNSAAQMRNELIQRTYTKEERRVSYTKCFRSAEEASTGENST